MKPENILLFEDGYPKLTDFGISKRLQYNSQLIHETQGTYCYLAPEMMSGKGYGKGIDLWALGILAHELLFKTIPFHESVIKSPSF